MAKHALTPRFVANIGPEGTYRFKPDAAGRIEIGDMRVEGLWLRITRRGYKSWSYLYRARELKNGRHVAGPQRRLNLGPYPDVDLKQAREIAMDYREMVLAGKDPGQQQDEEERLTVENVVQQYYETDYKHRSRRPELWLQRMEKWVLPRWGHRHITDVTRRDAHKLLDDVRAELRKDVTDPDSTKGRGATREVRKQCHSLWVWAMDREYVRANVFYRLNRPELVAPKDVRTPLTDDQIRELWALDVYIVAQLRLILLLGARKVETGHALWSEFDLEARTFTIPKQRHKGNRETVIPLSSAAIDVLNSIPKMGSEYVFKRGYYLDSNRLRAAQSRLSYHLRPHDLRATCATRLARLGVQRDVIQLCLGQALHGLIQTYDKHTYLEEKRDAMEKYGQHIMEVVGR